MCPRLSPALVLAVALTAGGCNQVVAPSKNQQETFTGTISPGQGNVHPFKVSKSGEYSVSLASLTPPVNAYVLLVFGQNQSGGCGIIQSNIAVVGSPALTGPVAPGDYCAGVYDYYNSFTTAVAYSLTVSHP